MCAVFSGKVRAKLLNFSARRDTMLPMLEISGKYNRAKVFTDLLDEKSREQIENLCNMPFAKGSSIRLMPDVHAGAGCTIGTTMTVADRIPPNMVGVDIGCGMETVVIKKGEPCGDNFDPALLDKTIHALVPAGVGIRDSEHEFVRQIPFEKIRCKTADTNRARKSIGTLGGGNHFIEANRDDEGNLYLVIHSGSRNIGKQIAEYYQNEAWNRLSASEKESVPKDLACASGQLFDDYVNDMKIIQNFALVNRKAMMQVILDTLAIPPGAVSEQFSTIHNYIDTESMILRKGAVSAKLGEKLIIPINMRDGSIVCEGLGNRDWNFSAPHGAGRLMSRTKAFESLSMEDFKSAMTGIYSTSVNRKTLDESPMAYKSMDDILAHISPSAKLLKIIKPVYNYKAAEGNWKGGRKKNRGG